MTAAAACSKQRSLGKDPLDALLSATVRSVEFTGSCLKAISLDLPQLRALSQPDTCCCLQEAEESAQDPLDALLSGDIQSVEFTGGCTVVDAPRGHRVYLPGSFNPLHEGHRWEHNAVAQAGHT